MFTLSNVSNQLFAAVASVAVSALFLAAAIVPVSNGVILPGVMA
nr:enoyl-CoA hydratase [Parerythrobacter lutipelagi]